MALLVVFAFVAGAATALSPCVLPVLPVALSAGATGGRGRPLGVGARLGLSFTFPPGGLVYVLYAPCAGPILAGVITVSATQDFTAGRLAVALSYSLGTAVVLYAVMLGGRRLISPLARRSAAFQPAIGAGVGAGGLVVGGPPAIRLPGGDAR